MIEKAHLSAGYVSIPVNRKNPAGRSFEQNQVQTPSDRVDVSSVRDENRSEKRSKLSRISRVARKNVARAGSVAGKVTTAVGNIPLGIAEGFTKAVDPEKDISARKKTLAKISTINNVIVGSTVGAATFGPIGMLVGATTGYIGSVIKNFLDNRAGVMDNLIEKIDNSVDGQIEKLPRQHDSSKTRKAINSVVTGAIEGFKNGWKTGGHVGAGSGAGLMSGIGFVANDIKENAAAGRKERQAIKQQKIANDSTRKKTEKSRSLISQAMRVASGVICGFSGVMMNVPGGMVEGSLEAVEMGFHRRKITRPLLLFATNTGKIMPAALVGAAIGGAPGAAIGTAVGMVSASLTTVIDGKYGFNKGIIRKIDRAIGEVVENNGYNSRGYALYHNAAKGVLVGAYMGFKEGWNLGYKGGTEFAGGLFETPLEAAKDNKAEVNSLKISNQMVFDFIKEENDSAGEKTA